MHYAVDDMITEAVLHRPYKHFSAAFEELKWDQCDSLFKNLPLLQGLWHNSDWTVNLLTTSDLGVAHWMWTESLKKKKKAWSADRAPQALWLKMFQK